MRRRDFLSLFGVAGTLTPSAWPTPARASVPKIGCFWFGLPDPNLERAGLRRGLEERGYVPGRNLILEERYAEEDAGQTTRSS